MSSSTGLTSVHEQPQTDERGAAIGPAPLFPNLIVYLATLRKHRVLLIGLILVGSVVGGVLAFLQKPVYRAEVVIAPARTAEDSAVVSRLAGQFAGLAALAGIGGAGGDDTQRAVAVLSSEALAGSFIGDNQLLPVLFESRWDAAKKAWIEQEGGQPTQWRAVQKFDDDVRKISRDLQSGTITVAMEWHDRHAATKWANEYVALANQVMRVRAIAEANAALKSLNRQLEQSGLLETKSILYSLVESQVSKLTLAEARPEFAFTVLDPAIAPDEDAFVRPRRFAIVFLSGVIGLLIGFVIVIGREIARHADR